MQRQVNILKRVCVWAGAWLSLSSCSMLMPDEIVRMQARTEAIAATMKSAHPDWFQSYDVDSRPMHAVVATDTSAKPLVIFIHGSPGSWQGWADYLDDEALRAKAHLIAVDRPGFGNSGAGKVERSLAQQSKDLAPLLNRARKGQRVILVGHSYGGPLAVRLAMDHPTKVTDLILLAASVDPELEETKWYQYPADWRLIRWAVPESLVVTNQEIMALQQELTTMLPQWATLRQRVSIVHGEKDDLVPVANVDFAVKQLVNAASVEVIRLPMSNHFLPWNQTELVKETIRKHLH